MNRGQMQFAVPQVTQVVKIVLILSISIFLLQLVGDFSGAYNLVDIFGFTPERLAHGWIWQPFTYVFLHSGIFHILFNLLVVWSIGSELEALWGTKTFVSFFFTCGVGAALTYGLFCLIGMGPGINHPVVGSSGVVYGLLLAYGILFGERMMYFFLLFPMPAKYFVMVLGGVELISGVFYSRDGIAHAAHLGGMLFGFIYLAAMASWRKRVKSQGIAEIEARERQKRLKKAGHLRLVPNKDEKDDDDEPQHWN